MKLSEAMREKMLLSFELFPPKTEKGMANLPGTIEHLMKYRPEYISCTYGAGGGNVGANREVCQMIRNAGTIPVTHFTVIKNTKEGIRQQLERYLADGVDHMLALRGDIPKDNAFPLPNQYRYACELIEDIKQQGDFCIGAACYPEGHVESEHKKDDIAHLKQKVDCGVDFLTTQMFFDNNILYNFLYRAREKGVTVPVIPGIMPVTNANQVKRILSMSGTNLPERFKAIVDRFGDNPKAMQQAGIAYATDQIIDLFANGINHVHVYSMNKPEVAAAIQANLSEILNK